VSKIEGGRSSGGKARKPLAGRNTQLLTELDWQGRLAFRRDLIDFTASS
jgi:hypothetical protein